MDLDQRFKMLQMRLNHIDISERRHEDSDFNNWSSPRRAEESPTHGLQIFASRDSVSVGSSSGSTIYDRTTQNMQFRVGNASNSVKTAASNSFHDEAIFEFQGSNEHIVSTVPRAADEYSTGSRNVVIGRPRIASVNYKRGDTITVTLQDSKSPRTAAICQHCNCCRFVPAAHQQELRTNQSELQTSAPNRTGNGF